MQRRHIAILTVASVILSQSWAAPIQAQMSRKAFVRLGAERLQKYESHGSRCGLEVPYVIFSENNYVLSSQESTALLRPGDHLYSVADRNVHTFEGTISVLKSLAPDATVRVGVRRHGQSLQLDVRCGDVLPLYSSLVAIERAIAESQFDSCLNAIHQFESFFGRSGWTDEERYYCTAFAKQFKDRESRATEYHALLSGQIEASKWDPSYFADTMDVVLSSLDWFVEAGQAALFTDLQGQLKAAVKSVAAQPQVPVESAQ